MMLCKIGQAARSLPEGDQVTLARWEHTGSVSNRVVSGKAMAQALTNYGHPVSEAVARRHRSGACLCYQTE